MAEKVLEITTLKSLALTFQSFFLMHICLSLLLLRTRQETPKKSVKMTEGHS